MDESLVRALPEGKPHPEEVYVVKYEQDVVAPSVMEVARLI